MPTDNHPIPSANFNRPPRLQLQDVPQDTIDLPLPPRPNDSGEQGWLMTILPVMGITVMALFYLLISFSGNRNGSLFALPLLVLAGITFIGTIITQRGRRYQNEQRQAEGELNYIRTLARKHAQIHASHNAQYAIMRRNYPPMETVFDLALSRDRQLWERRPDDPDYAIMRLGTGRLASRIRVHLPDPDSYNALYQQAVQIADTYQFLDNAPITASLRGHSAIGIWGGRSLSLQMLRAVMAHLAVMHTPQDLHLYVISSRANHDDWRWLEWLPHAQVEQRVAFDLDAIRRVMGTLSQLVDSRQKMQPTQTTPQVVLIVDSPQLVESEPIYATLLREGHQIGVTVMCLVSTFDALPSDCDAVIQVTDDGRCHYHSTDGTEIRDIHADQLSTNDAEQLARALASVTVYDNTHSGRVPQQVDFLDIYDVKDVEDLHERIQENWRRDIPNGVLPYPVRIGRESLAVNTEIWLDEDHHGSHGMLAGTTGSGKSELLQTLVCALAIEHDPRLVNFMLIDFKGGSTFNLFSDLPHVVGMVTNLEQTQVERALAALKAETEARQQFLKRVNIRDITQYHRYYARTNAQIHDPNYQPLPHLFVIVDEFTQLAKEMPEFLQELVRTVQVGRSLGLHLILGTQSPMDVITDEMNDNLQFRICLRVQNIEASRAMLRRPDAAYLPVGLPGRGYFQVGERGIFKQFQTAYVGGEYRQKMQGMDSQTMPLTLDLIADDGRIVDLTGESAHPQHPFEMEEIYTVAHAITESIQSYSRTQNLPRIAQMLLPPLPARANLTQVFDLLNVGGWDGRAWQSAGTDEDGTPIQVGSAPIGIVDDIHNRLQKPLWVHLNVGQGEFGGRRDGHVLIMGAPSTGKTTMLRTLAISQAVLHAPESLHMYFLSFTGGGLNDLGDLPHAERVVHGTETERVRRLFGRLINTLNARQSGQFDATQPVIMVCIDQYEQFRDSYYEQHLADFERLIHEGRAVGIYIIVTASSIGAIPERLRSLIQQRIALQLGNRGDYVLVVGHLGAHNDDVLPLGRGYMVGSPPLACQMSLPCYHADIINDALDEMRRIISSLRDSYLKSRNMTINSASPEDTQAPLPIKELPRHISLESLPLASSDDKSRLVTTLGRYDDDLLSPFVLDWWESGSHYVVTGQPSSGKTNLLRLAVLSACQQYAPENCRVLLVDFSDRGLRPLKDLRHVVHYVTDVVDLQAQLAHLQSELKAFRAYDDDVPATILVIDDYDAVSDALGLDSPLLRQLRDHVRLHSDSGLYIWVAGYLERVSDPLIKQLVMRRSGFGLSLKESLYNLNVRATGLSDEAMPAGRAYFADHNVIHVVQTALVENPQRYVTHINQHLWVDSEQARWKHPTRRPDNIVEQGNPRSVDIDTQGLIDDLLGSGE